MAASHPHPDPHLHTPHATGAGTRRATPVAARPRRRFASAVLVAAVVWLSTGGVAGAATVRPGGTEAVIDAVEPSVDGITVRVLGGDDFLEVAAEPGTEVLVPGYSGEPYLRIRADGTVERNTNSPAVALNAERDGLVDPDVAGRADPDAPPEWEPTGQTGRVAWHDHRVHWMLPSDPVAAPDGVIQVFDVPLVVDGTDVVVTGRLQLATAAFPWALLVTAGVGALVLLALHRTRRSAAPTDLRPVGPWLLLAAGIAAVAVSAGVVLATPPEAGGPPWVLLLAGAGAVAAVLACLRSDRIAVPAGIAAIGLLNGWWVSRVGVLWLAVVPNSLPGWADRVGTALVAGVGVACLLAASGLPPPRRVSSAAS